LGFFSGLSNRGSGPGEGHQSRLVRYWQLDHFALLVAKEKGFFDKETLKVQLITFTTGAAAVDAVSRAKS
jgi:ABC-type nitrate/sulfonate/bicarbonate transport system substrate-binding protein